MCDSKPDGSVRFDDSAQAARAARSARAARAACTARRLVTVVLATLFVAAAFVATHRASAYVNGGRFSNDATQQRADVEKFHRGWEVVIDGPHALGEPARGVEWNEPPNPRDDQQFTRWVKQMAARAQRKAADVPPPVLAGRPPSDLDFTDEVRDELVAAAKPVWLAAFRQQPFNPTVVTLGKWELKIGAADVHTFWIVDTGRDKGVHARKRAGLLPYVALRRASPLDGSIAVTQSLKDVIAKTDRSGDSVSLMTEKPGPVFAITSRTGIGGATLTRRNERWPDPLLLRIHLTSLEQLSLAADMTTLNLSVPNHGDKLKPIASIVVAKQASTPETANEEEPVDDRHAMWPDMRRFDAAGRQIDKVGPHDGWFEVRVPPALLADNPKSLAIRWIDFYRN